MRMHGPKCLRDRSMPLFASTAALQSRVGLAGVGGTGLLLPKLCGRSSVPAEIRSAFTRIGLVAAMPEALPESCTIDLRADVRTQCYEAE